MASGAGGGAPPLVLIVMPDQWRRALLRAALREAGYDAVGARDLAEALGDRAPARLIVVDQRVLRAPNHALLARLLHRHEGPVTVLISESGRGPVGGTWRQVIQRPASIEDVVNAVRRWLPLAPEAGHSVD